ncbi:hypothetical protein [Nannocystis pusilla]|uniref:hypothetical protein n=1 Tax=Nannocystis pusilla TaxID=889268 RepID=UPI003DA2F975
MKEALEEARPALSTVKDVARAHVIGALWSELTLTLVNAVEAYNQEFAPTDDDLQAFNDLRTLHAAVLECAGAAAPEHIHEEVYQRLRRGLNAAGRSLTPKARACWPDDPATAAPK